MRLRYFFGLILALLLLVTSPSAKASSYAKGLTRGVEILYELDRVEKGALPGQSLAFSHLDFLRCCGEVPLEGVYLEQVPPVADGTLVLGGEPVTEGSWIPTEMIEKLRFVPTEKVAFETELVFSLGEDAPSRTMVLHFEESPVQEVISEDMTLETYGNVACFAALPAIENATYVIAESPQKGVIQLDRTSGAFVYHPSRDHFGSDQFRYFIRDAYGSTSKLSTVKIKTVMAPQNLFFPDCVGKPYHNAAIRACAAGALSYTLDEDGLPAFCPEDEMGLDALLRTVQNHTALTEEAQQAFSALGNHIPRWEAATILETLLDQSPQRSAKILAFRSFFSARSSSLISPAMPPAYFKQIIVSAGKAEKPSSLPKAVSRSSSPL